MEYDDSLETFVKVYDNLFEQEDVNRFYDVLKTKVGWNPDTINYRADYHYQGAVSGLNLEEATQDKHYPHWCVNATDFLKSEDSELQSTLVEIQNTFTTDLINPFFEEFNLGKFILEDWDLRLLTNYFAYGNYSDPHPDRIVGGPGFSIIFYLNPVYDVTYGGYLTFLDVENNEIKKCVSPKPGRAILFDSRIVHQITAMTNISTEDRISLAFQYQFGG